VKVKFNNIGKKYEGREEFTLRNINLDIDDKDFCVILGPSGCGKTTLLRMIAGLNSITEGDLIFGEKKVNEVPSKDRDIAMVFQSYALYPHMTVYQNMAFSLSMRSVRKDIIHERVLDAAKLLQIEEYLYSKPSDISGGQRQRVALGRAIVRNPKIFLMDEPLSNLDAKLREHMRVELVRLHKKLDTTTIYVTHDQIEAMTMATKIILLNEGKIQQAGKPDEFYAKPNNIFVAQFIGSPSINILDGRIEKDSFISNDDVITMKIHDNDSAKLAEYDNKPIKLGIRSERFLAGKGPDLFKATVDVIEMLGKEKTLYVRTETGVDLTLTFPGHFKYEQGEVHEFGLDSAAVHFFDADTGDRIN
jgi:multiple sugar transport system ATP-binding protein